MTAIEEVRIAAPELRGNNFALGYTRDREVALDGPAGCVAGETRIYNPVTDTHTSIKELYEKGIAPIVQTLMGAIQADVPFRKGVRELYRVTLASGRQCIVTDNHLFLTPDGWQFASACSPSQRLLVSVPCLYPTILESDLLVSPQDALRLSQKPLGYRESCHASGCSCDVQPHLAEDTDLVFAPLQADVHVHNRGGLYRDDLDSLPGYTHQHQLCDHHAKMCCSPLTACMACTQFHAQSGISLQVDVSCQCDEQSQKEKRHLSPTALPLPDGDNMRHRALLLEEYPVSQEVLKRGFLTSSIPEQLMPYFLFADMTQESTAIPLELRACNLLSYELRSLKYVCKYDYTIQWDTVSSVEYERTDEYFDLHVPIAEHYLAEGIWHHNTGKTVAALFKIHILLSSYPGSRALVARKTNTALSGSAMVTYRSNILNGRRDIHWFGGNKVEPAAFKYPNGSEMIVNGLDKPEKVQSAEFDWAYINEATECKLEDIEFVRMRLRPRTGVADIPYRQLIMDCNPNAPTHWLNQRMNEGITRRLVSRHQDNPRYFDLKTNDWTPDGREYIFGILGGLTGVRLARYVHGIWAAAEGTVYEDSWDRNRNVGKRFPIPKEWPRYMALDFGYTHPFVCKWYAVDPDGRLICYRELYKTKTLVEDHAKEIKRLSRWGEKDGDPLPRAVICDHDAEDRATFERHTGLYTTPAKKTVSDGIQAVQVRLRPAGDGKPRLVYFEDALVERDEELARQKKPVCTVEEFDSYVWKKSADGSSKEEPVKENDHGLDCDRYMVAHLDLKANTVSYFPSIWR